MIYQFTWQHTRKINNVIAVHNTFSLNWICGKMIIVMSLYQRKVFFLIKSGITLCIMYYNVIDVRHKQMVEGIWSDLRLHTHQVIEEFRKNGTWNCKYERETEIDRAALPFVVASLFPAVYCRTVLSPRETWLKAEREKTT